MRGRFLRLLVQHGPAGGAVRFRTGELVETGHSTGQRMIEPQLYTTEEVAHMLRLSPKTVLRKGRAGVIPGLIDSVSRRKRWLRVKVDAYLRKLQLIAATAVAESKGQEGHKGHEGL